MDERDGGRGGLCSDGVKTIDTRCAVVRRGSAILAVTCH